MNGTLHISTGQERERVASIDSEGGILRFHPLPLSSLMVLNLEGGDGLTEQKGPGAKVGMAAAPETTEFQVFFRTEFGVLHVTQVILNDVSYIMSQDPPPKYVHTYLTLNFIFVDVGEVVFG